MTKSKAREQAKRDVSMYRQGRGWIVIEWIERVGAEAKAPLLTGRLPYREPGEDG